MALDESATIVVVDVENKTSRRSFFSSLFSLACCLYCFTSNLIENEEKKSKTHKKTKENHFDAK